MTKHQTSLAEFLFRMANEEASYGTGYYGQDSWLAAYQGAKRLAMEALCCSKCLGSGEQQYEIYAGDQVVEDGVCGCDACGGSGDRKHELRIACQWGVQPKPYTPGPWSVARNRNQIFVHAPLGWAAGASGPAWAAVADVCSPDNADEANANLIAAAPDLLESLLHCTTDEGPDQGQLERARAAIRKALGGAA